MSLLSILITSLSTKNFLQYCNPFSLFSFVFCAKTLILSKKIRSKTTLSILFFSKDNNPLSNNSFIKLM